METLIKTLCDDYNNCNTYLYIKNDSAVIIDPANSVKQIMKLLDGKRVVGIFITHGHYDHFKDLHALLCETSCPVYLTKKAYDKLFDMNTSCAKFFTRSIPTDYDNARFVFVNDSKKVILSNDFEATILQTKGHTDCGISIIIDDNIFTGDTLFFEGVGRSDLPTSNTIQLVESIKRLMSFKKDYNVYPGHDKPTTIFYEQKHNPFYQRIK